jgi:hypothetical protein
MTNIGKISNINNTEPYEYDSGTSGPFVKALTNPNGAIRKNDSTHKPRLNNGVRSLRKKFFPKRIRIAAGALRKSASADDREGLYRIEMLAPINGEMENTPSPI